ncbi:MAG: four helix bundle protein [Planctomycetota bacterium]|nr:four helix bundle protein [Planctomycetota bacterium]MDA1139033.1 four helix bundle protein [Planctomycetota bacterium]
MATKFDLEERLLDFSSRIIRLCEALPNNRAGNHVGGQLLRAGTSPYFNHGEAQAAESANDFIHKMSICLKELKESFRCLRLIKAVPLIKRPSKIDELLNETDELIRIFYTSIQTAKSNEKKTQATRKG